jgi:hypothetical protein
MTPKQTVVDIWKERWENAVFGARSYPEAMEWQGKALIANANYVICEALAKGKNNGTV